MGAGASTAIGALTRADVIEKTRNTQSLLNLIFEYLMTDIQIVDFYRLLSPDECRKYVLVLASRIHESFLSLDILPSKDRSGKLYYTTVKDHVSPPKEEDKRFRQQTCLALSFFYVRIFQIFGALALTLIDDATAMPKIAAGLDMSLSGIQPGAGAGIRPAAGRIGDVPYAPSGRYTSLDGKGSIGTTDRESRGWFGGGPFDALSGATSFDATTSRPDFKEFNFLPLRKSADGKYTAVRNDNLGRSFYRLDTARQLYFSYIPGTALIGGSQGLLLLHLDTELVIDGIRTTNPVLSMRVTAKGSEQRLAFGNEVLLQKGKMVTLRDLDLLLSPATVSRGGDLPSGEKRYTIFSGGRSLSPSEFFDDYGKRFKDILTTVGAKRTGGDTDWGEGRTTGLDRGRSVSFLDEDAARDYRRRMALESRPTPTLSLSRYLEPKDGDRRPGSSRLLSDDDVPMGMRISRMEYAVRQTKPLPTCVSRAIQLLTTKPAGGLSAISSICDKGFLVEDHDRRRAGTVRIGDSLEKAPGMVALVQLFYDTVTGPDKLAMSAPSLQSYTAFMMAMGELLGMFEKGAKVATDERTLKLPAISDKHMAGICQTLALTADGRLELPAEVATQVLPYVQQLFKQQLDHAGKAGMILSRLFSVEKSKDGFVRIRIHPSVLDGGFPVLERIAAGTREVLMQYYVGCEKTYRDGVDVIAKAAKKPPTGVAEGALALVAGKGAPAGAAVPKRPVPGPEIKGILKKPVGPAY